MQRVEHVGHRAAEGIYPSIHIAPHVPHGLTHAGNRRGHDVHGVADCGHVGRHRAHVSVLGAHVRHVSRHDVHILRHPHHHVLHYPHGPAHGGDHPSSDNDRHRDENPVDRHSSCPLQHLFDVRLDDRPEDPPEKHLGTYYTSGLAGVTLLGY